MSDIVLLYVFTRLDALSAVIGLLATMAALLTLGLCIWGMIAAHANPEEWHSPALKEAEARQLSRAPILATWAKRSGAFFVCLMLAAVLVPSKRDMAIIVGGKIALDAGRSETAKEISQEVLDAIRSQLKKAKEQ